MISHPYPTQYYDFSEPLFHSKILWFGNNRKIQMANLFFAGKIQDLRNFIHEYYFPSKSEGFAFLIRIIVFQRIRIPHSNPLFVDLHPVLIMLFMVIQIIEWKKCSIHKNSYVFRSSIVRVAYDHIQRSGGWQHCFPHSVFVAFTQRRTHIVSEVTGNIGMAYVT